MNKEKYMLKMGDTVIDYDTDGFIHVIIYLVIAVTDYSFLAVGGLFAKMLFILNGLKTCIFFVEPLIDGFKPSSVYDERSACV
jgi:hypothetical protein